MASVKIVDVVKKFNGTECEDLELWFDRFKVAIDLTSRSKKDDEKEKEMCKLIPLFVDGAAYRTWKQIPDADKEDLTLVKDALRRVFGKSKISAWQQLKNIRLLPGEQVDVVAGEVETLLGTIAGKSPVPEELVSLFFIDTLPNSIADQVRMQHGEKMLVKEVVSCAKALLASPSNAMVAAGVSGSSTRYSKRYPQTGESRRCYGCHKFGHLRRDCPVTCFRCRQRGHLANSNECPANKGNGQAGMASPDGAVPAVERSSVE